MTELRLWPGSPYPIGATFDGEGVNFAIFSEHATAVELCLFDGDDPSREVARVKLKDRHAGIWHAFLPDARPGQLYGYRVHGPYDPEKGHRFNPNQLLIDPYAKAISGTVSWSDEVFPYVRGSAALDLEASSTDSARSIPKSVVVDTAFTWGDDRPPQTPWSRTVIYEAHVKAMTARHPGVPERLRGTYLGLASDPILDHLLGLGVTAIELLPIQHFVTERRLADLGLDNYWGYSTIGFFAPDPRYASGARGQQVDELKTMVKAFHRVGLEVLLDVVYNHTGEGNHLGPALSLRGVDNATYYRLAEGNPREYVDFTGCGNTLDVRHPRALQLVLDSLRYWVTEMHVDGFRFDLAPVLARDERGFHGLARFLAMVSQDPVLSRVKLIAEPWDLGPGGYRLGAFPPDWAEWNGRYRDTVRRFWRGDTGQVPELASRLSGSSDVFQGSDRGPYASINFVTCHDGFTLNDLTSYESKHNQSNGEGNRDGTDDNFSRNWGVEGETTNPTVQRLRDRVMKNFIATLAFSQGVPMLSHGDELGRTQRGNNNAYCQDSELTWLDWNLGARERELLAFTRAAFRIRRANPVFRRRRFFAGDPVNDQGVKDVQWVRPDGAEMTMQDWSTSDNHVLGMVVHGDASDEVDERGRPNKGRTLLLVMNAGARAQDFTLPVLPERGAWRELVNTAQPPKRQPRTSVVSVPPHGLLLFEQHR
ncbi:MAG: glycogen debranching protein GlgX [Sorangiineae bacterium]|nr:glycogen debranching protein GlgX [Polyangiaceae bacterium]MEB2322722.1 glycogen debranching protein GlgX [Sorangiineae bacterium]